MTANTGRTKNAYAVETGRDALESKLTHGTNTSYYKLGDKGIEMGYVQGSESIEHLQSPIVEGGITRTTQVTVVREPHKSSLEEGWSASAY